MTSFSQILTPGQYPATQTNDDAAAGRVGEYISSSVAFGAAVSLTNNTEANITSISLTAGDWDVCGVGWYFGDAATTVTATIGCISTASATLQGVGTTGRTDQIYPGTAIYATGNNLSLPLVSQRVSIAATTTIYLVTLSKFAINTQVAYGQLWARRVR